MSVLQPFTPADRQKQEKYFVDWQTANMEIETRKYSK